MDIARYITECYCSSTAQSSARAHPRRVRRLSSPALFFSLIVSTYLSTSTFLVPYITMSHIEKVLSSYQHIGNQAYDTARSLTPDHAHDYLRWFLLDMPVTPILLIFHSLFAALKIRQITPPRTFWLKSFVITTFAAFGGSTLASLLSGRPPPLFTTSSNFMLTYIFAAWYIVNHMTPIRMFLSMRPVQAALAFGATAAKTRSIFGFVDDFVREFPGAAMGAIVLGGLAGSGGQLFVSLERIVQLGLSAPFEFSAPGWGFKSAYIASAAYYIAVDHDEIMRNLPIPLNVVVDRSVARFYISSALCVHAALETLYGQHINPFYWPERVIYAVTGLHEPFDTEDTIRRTREHVRNTYVPPPRNSQATGSKARPAEEGLRKRARE